MKYVVAALILGFSALTGSVAERQEPMKDPTQTRQRPHCGGLKQMVVKASR